ncbi:MAG: signal peptidase I, partial [Thermoanaerobaculia bacterium]
MNFALILFLLTLVTGVVWLADKVYFARRRAREAPEPWWIEYPKSFFPVLLIVFLLRSFLAEPFRIPSSSMRPTLVVGDYILVNKFSYGLRLPILERKIVPIADPQRGDVVVFRYPVNPSQDFIKRVVGVGGDVVEYRDKRLSVNGKPLPQKADGSYSYLESLRFETTERRIEQTQALDGPREYTIAVNPQAPPIMLGGVRSFPGKENCVYNEPGFTCRVP